jgi:hypothetical protein
VRSLGALALLALFLSLGPTAPARAAAPADVTFAQEVFRTIEGDGYADIRVYRNSLPVSRLEVWYDTTDRSAVASQDYSHSYGRLVFDVGVSEMTFPVEILDDDDPERLEELSLLLSPAYNASTTTGPPALLLISDDDPAPVPSTVPLRDTNAANRSSVTAPPNRQAQAGATGTGGQQPATAQPATVRRRVTTRQSPTTPFELRVQAGGGDSGGTTGDLAVDPALAVLAGLLLAVVAGKVWFACRPAS